MNRRRFTQQLAAAVGAMSLGRTTRGEGTSPAAALAVDGERINSQLLELAQFGKNPYGGVSRVAYSEFDRQGRDWAMNVMRKAGLAVSVDAAGNIFGRRPGSVATLKPLVFGSHIDSVPDGGNYDGDVGSLSAIEVARTLAANDLMTRHPLEVGGRDLTCAERVDETAGCRQRRQRAAADHSRSRYRCMDLRSAASRSRRCGARARTAPGAKHQSR